MEVQSANKQHPVPQNVMDVEFKLIGELTVRQFTYLLVFWGGAGLLLKFSVLPGVFRYPLIITLILMGAGFAFMPLNDITMDKWIVNYIRAITNPRIRTWKHIANIPSFFLLSTEKIKTQVSAVGNRVKQRLRIEELVKSKIDVEFSDESDLLKKEGEFMKRLGFTPPEIQKTHLEFGQLTTTTLIEPLEEIKPDDTLPKIITGKEIWKEELEEKSKYSSIAIKPKEYKHETSAKPYKKEEAKKPKITAPPRKEDLEPKIQAQSPQQLTRDDSKIKEEYLRHIRELNALKQKLIEEIERNRYKILEGKEKEIQDLTKEEQRKEFERIQQKNKELEEKLRSLEAARHKTPQLKAEELGDILAKPINIAAPHVSKLSKEERESSIFTGFLEKLQEANKRQKLPPLPPENDEEGILFEKEIDLDRKRETKENIDKKEEIKPAKPKTQEEKHNFAMNRGDTQGEEKIRRLMKEKQKGKEIETRNIFGNIVKRSKPNVVYGSTQDTEGKIIPEVIIIIKDAEGSPVRALKSNKVGEFETITPLTGGDYKIEATKEGFKFKPETLKALGSEIDPVKLIGSKV